MQIIENPDGIVTYLIFNQAIYSEEKMHQAVEVISELVGRILQADEPEKVRLAELM